MPRSLTMLGNAGGDYPRDFNPYNPSVISGTPGLIYETLLYFNRLDGTVKPWLASSFDRTSDATGITFHLRQGVVWSDGQPFTSADVVFTLGLLKQYSAMDINSITPFIKSVSAPDCEYRGRYLKQALLSHHVVSGRANIYPSQTCVVLGEG